MKKNIITMFLFLLLIISIIYSKETSTYFFEQMTFIVNVIVPSLFPFMIFVNFLLLSNSITLLNKLLLPFSKILNISSMGLICIISAFLGGYPYSAILIKDFKEKGYISQNEANNILYFFLFPSLSFQIALYNNNKVVFKIILINVLIAFLILLFINKPTKNVINDNNIQTKDLFINVMNNTYKSIFSIAFTILFFSLLSFYVSFLIKSNFLNDLISGMLEFSLTSITLSTKNDIVSNLLLSFILSFGSFSIFFQMKYYIKNIKLIKLILIRLIFSIVVTSILYFYL